MNTDQLIQTLAADTDRRERLVGTVLVMALATGGSISIAMFFATLGFRADIDTAIYNPFFDLKFLVSRLRCWLQPSRSAFISPDRKPRSRAGNGCS